MAWVCTRLCKLQKRCTRLAAESDKVYQLLVHGRWFYLASTTTKTGRHDIAESGFKTPKINQSNQINNISVITWQSVLLVEETGVPDENYRPVASHWQTLSHNVVSSIPRLSRVRTHTISGDRYWLHRQFEIQLPYDHDYDCPYFYLATTYISMVLRIKVMLILL